MSRISWRGLPVFLIASFFAAKGPDLLAASPPSREWTHRFADSVEAVRPAADGGYLQADFGRNDTLHVTRILPSGSRKWQFKRKFPVSGLDDFKVIRIVHSAADRNWTVVVDRQDRMGFLSLNDEGGVLGDWVSSLRIDADKETAFFITGNRLAWMSEAFGSTVRSAPRFDSGAVLSFIAPSPDPSAPRREDDLAAAPGGGLWLQTRTSKGLRGHVRFTALDPSLAEKGRSLVYPASDPGFFAPTSSGGLLGAGRNDTYNSGNIVTKKEFLIRGLDARGDSLWQGSLPPGSLPVMGFLPLGGGKHLLLKKREMNAVFLLFELDEAGTWKEDSLVVERAQFSALHRFAGFRPRSGGLLLAFQLEYAADSTRNAAWVYRLGADHSVRWTLKLDRVNGKVPIPVEWTEGTDGAFCLHTNAYPHKNNNEEVTRIVEATGTGAPVRGGRGRAGVAASRPGRARLSLGSPSLEALRSRAAPRPGQSGPEHAGRHGADGKREMPSPR